MKKAYPNAPRTLRPVLKSALTRATGKYTMYGTLKRRDRPEPSMPKFKCLAKPLPD